MNIVDSILLNLLYIWMLDSRLKNENHPIKIRFRFFILINMILYLWVNTTNATLFDFFIYTSMSGSGFFIFFVFYKWNQVKLYLRSIIELKHM